MCKQANIPTAVFKYLEIKKRSQKVLGPLSYMCIHNRCGFINPYQCTHALGECCHQAWHVGVGEKMCSRAHLKTCFYKIKGQRNDDDKPTLDFRWDRYLDMKSVHTNDAYAHSPL